MKGPSPSGFNAQVNKIEREFQDDAQERVSQIHSASADPLTRQTLKLLNTLARKVKGEHKKTITEIREKLASVALTPKEKRELRKIRNLVGSPEDKVEHMKKLLLTQQALFFEEEAVKAKKLEPVVIQVIASEAFIKQ